MGDGINGFGASEFKDVRPLRCRVGADRGICTAGDSDCAGVAGDGCSCVGGRAGSATATAAASDMSPVFGGSTGDNEPKEFWVWRDGELRGPGRFGESVTIDARSVFFGSEETVAPTSGLRSNLVESFRANDAFEIESDFDAGSRNLQLDGIVAVVLGASVSGDLLPAIRSIRQ